MHHNRYLVPGLALPPGSKITKITKDNPEMYADFQMPFPTDEMRHISIVFDNSAGWEHVSMHFDRLMESKGYIVIIDERLKNNKISEEDWEYHRTYLRNYRDSDSKFLIGLHDADVSMSTFNNSGRFYLTVTKYLKDNKIPELSILNSITQSD